MGQPRDLIERDGVLVEGKVGEQAGAPVDGIASRRDARPVEIQVDIAPIARVRGVGGASGGFFVLPLYEFAIETGVIDVLVQLREHAGIEMERQRAAAPGGQYAAFEGIDVLSRLPVFIRSEERRVGKA